MSSWIHQLGLYLLKDGALSYIVSDEDQIAWDGKDGNKQKIDMAAFYHDHVRYIELKETENDHRKGIKFKQIERYYYLCRDSRYKNEFWVYVYWHKHGIITGVKMNHVENLQVFAVDTDGTLQFYASIGLDPATRIRKPVEFKLKISNEV